MDILKGKDQTKARMELIRYLMSLPDSTNRSGSDYSREGGGFCLCAKGQTVKKFFGKIASLKINSGVIDYYPFNEEKYTVKSMIGITDLQWSNMEILYEDKEYTFKEIATWLQTLPGWPTVL